MINLKLPSLKTVVENIALETAKLDKILLESQSRVASYLDIHYPDCQEIIFLLGGKAVKAGRLTPDGSRTILDVKSAIKKLKQARAGSISFYETTKLLMVVVLGTFIFEPPHAKLKSKQIDFKGLLDLLKRKRFIGYLELKTNTGLNYLTFFNGEPRKGYFARSEDEQDPRAAAEVIASLVEKSDDKGEINVYESVGENDLSDRTGQTGHSSPDSIASDVHADEAVVQLYERLFKIMVSCSEAHLSHTEIDTMFMQCLTNATLKNATLFRGAGTNEDGSLLSTGLINFKQLLKSKHKLPPDVQDQHFLEGLIELGWLRLLAMQERLPNDAFKQYLHEIEKMMKETITTNKTNKLYQQFNNSFLRVIAKIQNNLND